MAKLSLILDLIAAISDRSVDRAIGAALPSATPQDARDLVDLALERGRHEALAGVVLAFDRLDPRTRQRVIASADRLERAMRRLSAEKDPRAAANALRIAVATRRGTLAYVIADLLRRGPQELRRDAALGLLALTDLIAPRGEADAPADPADAAAPAPTGVDADGLARAVRDALRSYQFHDQPAVLRAALVLLPRTAAALREALSTPRGSPAQAVRRLIASPEDARVLGALPWLLTVPTLRGDADAELRRAVAAGQWPGVLGRWPVLLTPAVRAAVRKLAKPEALLATPHAAATMPAHAAIGLCHWLDVLRLPADEAVRQYGGLRAHGDRRVRLAALRRLLAMPAGPTRLLALQAIEPFCEDDDAVIARTALRALIRHRWPDLTKLLMKLVNSPHESVRRIAGRRLAPLGFDRLWHVWRQLTAAQRIAAGRALIKISDQFHQQLARKIESPDRKDRVRALTMIAQLNQGAFFAGALIELAHDRDERIAATAVAALGSADGISECRFATADLAQASHAHDDSITKPEIGNRQSAITETLEWATHHADARVRANAVESLSKLRACRDVRRLTEMAGRDDPRPRANAIMALLDMRMVDSLAALHAMLHDDLPAQRISALWLVENMGILNVAEDVAEMSVDDADPGVRQRARRVIEHLIQHMRSGAAAHAPGPAGDAAEAGRIGALDETRPSRERLAS